MLKKPELTKFDNFTDILNGNSIHLWQYFTKQFQDTYEKLADTLDTEFQVPVSEADINKMLYQFVVKNVSSILDLHLNIYDGWFRLYATINIYGIFTEVASNFKLVHVQLDRNRQRLVFQQLTQTDVLSLNCQFYPKKSAVKSSIWLYRKLLQKDPLGFLLDLATVAKAKEDIIYLDMNRWLKKNQNIMQTLHKVQVNYGLLAEEQLILKANINIADVLNFGQNNALITEADNPEAKNDPVEN